ncbi:GNAT family N-acetyltransferase [Lactococcus kimchii]|uniref:GNAT family N-acetyltransferase n=1 Tax=Lactococcus sp. S-13 TaxID=2507158 RepID=UPI0010233579|nr:GNAT family N-acetyltransferase [Lactococcus sp. S-13]RZI48287.1 GNAT family N-acetyltransferase [Lactococcus sp. S-13]
MRIRRIDLSDARALWELQKQLDTETKFMLLEPEERKFDLSQTIGQISRFDFLIGAEVDGKLIGYLSAKRGHTHRIEHMAYIVVGILEDFQHQGIGGQFFILLDEWAKDKGIKRLELTVITKNYAAIALYQKSGFEIEGVRKAAMCVDGEFTDEFYMSKVFE